MSEFQSIAKGLLGLTHPEIFASIDRRRDCEPSTPLPAKPGQNRFAALLASLGRGAWFL
ncbi:MAG TPA: hypothetical protein VGI65_15610 [Steroidobacteraceae bacterium]|jgi:hypothetical protein